MTENKGDNKFVKGILTLICLGAVGAGMASIARQFDSKPDQSELAANNCLELGESYLYNRCTRKVNFIYCTSNEKGCNISYPVIYADPGAEFRYQKRQYSSWAACFAPYRPKKKRKGEFRCE